MSDHCHQGSCSNEHSHHQHGEEGCCSCCGKEHHECSCCCHDHDHHHGKYSHELLALADDAWMEILKDKIKAEILKTSGAQLDQMAKLISDANHSRWKAKLNEKSSVEDFEDHLHELLHQDKKT